VADFIVFDEGANELLDSGTPATVHFLLSTKGVDAGTAFTEADELGTGDGEITGTGYARQPETTPAAAAREIEWPQAVWETLTDTDWPAAVRSVVAATTADDTGVMLCAWNLQVGGAARDLSAASTTQRFTATLTA
jgi:hypothetical protein